VAMIEQLAKSEKLRIDLHSSKDHFLALNIGSEKSVSALSMLNILGEQLKHKPFYEIANRPVFDVDRTWASMTKTYTYVESRNFMNLEDGLREFTNWFLNYSV
jgi:UDP-glucose 4-epimerase